MGTKSPGMVAHYLRYSTANVMVILAGFVSFPVLTRLLDNTQYGILGYYETWALMAVAFGKLGTQHALQRYYPHDGDAGATRSFATNYFHVPMAISVALWLLVVAGLLAYDWATGSRQSPVMWLALASVPMAVYASLVDTVLRVRESSKLVMLSRIGSRWLQLVLMLSAVVWIQQSAFAVYGAKLAGTLLVVAFYLYWARRHLPFSRAAVDAGIARQGLSFGGPMIIYEAFAVALILVDRVMLKFLTGDFAVVGIFSIGAALALQVHMFMNLAIFESFTPMANRLNVTEGASAVRALKSSVLMPMTYASVGVSVLLWCFGTDVILALSGPDKVASGPVFAVMGVTRALLPVLLVAGYGLIMGKRSTQVMVLMCGSLLVNSVLNWVWIPQFGVMGAVYATLVSSTALAVGHCVWVPRDLLKLPDARTVVTAGGVAAGCIVAVWATGLFGLQPGWERLLVGGTVVGLAYCSLVLLLDARIRMQVLGLLRSRSRAGAIAAGS